MQKRPLGRTGLAIAPVVFGGNVFGWTADAKTSFALLDRLAEAGLDTIDTADVYSAWAPGNKGGESETILGDWMKSRGARSKTIVITKVGSPMGEGKKGLKPAYVAEAVEASLKRLQTDVIDLYLAHWPDPETPHEETLGAFGDLVGRQDPRLRLLEFQRRAAAGLARRRAREGPAALRRAAARIQPLRPFELRGTAARSLPRRGHRRDHLFQPRQGLPVGQIPQRGRSRPEPARRRRARPI